MTYKFDIWYTAKNGKVTYLETITVDAESYVDAVRMARKDILSKATIGDAK